MADVHSFDIHILGLSDPTMIGRARFATTMERLTGRPSREFESEFPSPVLPAFTALDDQNAKMMAETLGAAGILIEIRPSNAAPSAGDIADDPEVRVCPACDHRQAAANHECEKCGIIFQKYEREQLAQMQKDHTLEQAMVKAMQVREEWLQRANQYLESRPLKKEATSEFLPILISEEVPFLRLNSGEGPILMTSRRLITKRDAKFHSIPYEMIKDVDYGGGRIVTKKSKFRLQLDFHAPFPLDSGEVIKNIAWHLDKESSFFKDVVIDWGYSRNFICGSCGERELDYRTEGTKVHMRCMHCATDHEIDLAECVAVPLMKE